MAFGFTKNHSGLVKWALKGSQGDNPTYAASSNFTFNLDDLPVAIGGKCLYLAGIELDFVSTVANNNSAASVLLDRDFYRIYVQDIQLENCWHGTPISANHWKGTLWPLYEWFSCGYRFWAGRRRLVSTGVSSQVHRFRPFLPLGSGLFTKSHHTMLPALMYKKGTLVLNTAASTVLTGISTGASLSSGTIRATAVMVAEPEVRLGPAIEWIDYQTPYASNNESIELRSFGNATGLVGTEAGAGLSALAWVANKDGMPGAGDTANISRIAIPFRDQFPMRAMDPFFTELEQAADLNRGYQDMTNSTSPFPYPASSDTTEQTCDIFPLVTPSPDLELSKIQTVEGTQSYFLTISSGSGTHHTVAQHVRSWTPDAYEEARRRLIDAGVVGAVVGSPDVMWSSKVKNKQHVGDIHTKKLRYIPQRLVHIPA